MKSGRAGCWNVKPECIDCSEGGGGGGGSWNEMNFAKVKGESEISGLGCLLEAVGSCW